jgi:hypothetical protein
MDLRETGCEGVYWLCMFCPRVGFIVGRVECRIIYRSVGQSVSVQYLTWFLSKSVGTDTEIFISFYSYCC